MLISCFYISDFAARWLRSFGSIRDVNSDQTTSIHLLFRLMDARKIGTTTKFRWSLSSHLYSLYVKLCQNDRCNRFKTFGAWLEARIESFPLLWIQLPLSSISISVDGSLRDSADENWFVFDVSVESSFLIYRYYLFWLTGFLPTHRIFLLLFTFLLEHWLLSTVLLLLDNFVPIHL